MRKLDGIKHRWFFYAGLFLLVCMLAACGGASTTGSGSNGSGTTQKTPTSIPGYGTSNGCPDNTVINSAPPAANVIINQVQMNQTIAAHQGDVIEIRLPFGHKWTGPTSSQGILQLQPPAGYAWKADKVCVWRFVAKGTGTTQLVFHSQALCKPGQMCPMFIATMPFDVNVK